MPPSAAAGPSKPLATNYRRRTGPIPARNHAVRNAAVMSSVPAISPPQKIGCKFIIHLNVVLPRHQARGPTSTSTGPRPELTTAVSTRAAADNECGAFNSQTPHLNVCPMTRNRADRDQCEHYEHKETPQPNERS